VQRYRLPAAFRRPARLRSPRAAKRFVRTRIKSPSAIDVAQSYADRVATSSSPSQGCITGLPVKIPLGSRDPVRRGDASLLQSTSTVGHSPKRRARTSKRRGWWITAMSRYACTASTPFHQHGRHDGLVKKKWPDCSLISP
jgi:hypothetical protein